MSTFPRRSSSLGIYHVVIRGVNKQVIFEDPEDYRKYLKILSKYQSICGYRVLAYCLMSNHVHLLIKPEEMDLGRIFQHIGPSFVKWYNIKYQRVGHLFQSRYMSRPVNTSAQLLTVMRYIHQNPVKAAICHSPEKYEYSSFRDYFDNELIDASLVLSLMSREFFVSFNCEANEDKCMDIDEEVPRVLGDGRAIEFMRAISGCEGAAEFQALGVDERDEALREMWRAGVTPKQANRITGVSIGVIRKALEEMV